MKQKKTMKYEKKKIHSDIEPDQSFTFKTCFKGLTAFVSNWAKKTNKNVKKKLMSNLIEASAKTAEFTLERLAAEDLDVDAIVLQVDGEGGSLKLETKTDCKVQTTY